MLLRRASYVGLALGGVACPLLEHVALGGHRLHGGSEEEGRNGEDVGELHDCEEVRKTGEIFDERIY